MIRQTTEVQFSNTNVIISRLTSRINIYHKDRSSDKVMGLKAIALARPLL